MAQRRRPSPSSAPPAEPAPGPARPLSTASNKTEPQAGWAPGDTSGELVTVFVTNGVRTSDGPGPGVKRVPPAEAQALYAGRVAVTGDQPPRGWTG
jgi:hypothetical protein